MTSLASVTLEVADPASAETFYHTAFGHVPQVRLRAGEEPTSGFRGFTLTLTVSQPSTVEGFMESALAAGATTLKPATKSLWGFGGVVQAPDGTIWQIATSTKKNTGPATREYDEVVLLLGVEDVKATKEFYVGRGLTVRKSYGSKYVDFVAEAGTVTLGLYKRRALAKVAGVPADGTGSHRIVLGGTAGPFTDPDGFAWETAPLAAEA
ncbi:glyoxalase [Streptomyces sp. SID14478]|uniref:glyoxalase n=1 Tax=Streptomyces sp. SID14478 TaxID=2706073 RepID=UPI0013DA41C0|nr:glyoxalase [Streptomyces sp. SID14478]NEB76930.1 glyoxalase [Streptomyces sp. SID14478]